MHLFWKLYYNLLKLLGYEPCDECLKLYKSKDMWHNRHETLCQSCEEELYCECGQRLEDAWGTKGDGFCIMCR